jgi:hypothetical protein
MNRLNSILLHFAVPLSLLICKDLFVFYLNWHGYHESREGTLFLSGIR